jgi:hypothetical protein
MSYPLTINFKRISETAALDMYFIPIEEQVIEEDSEPVYQAPDIVELP